MEDAVASDYRFKLTKLMSGQKYRDRQRELSPVRNDQESFQAPEVKQESDAKDYEHSIDIYSIGSCMYELVYCSAENMQQILDIKEE